MRILIVFVVTATLFASCKSTMYVGNYGQVNQTQVVLSNSNFKVLGSFKGTATENKSKFSIKDQEGIISKAKSNMLANAKSAGVELTGSRTLTNVAVDMIDNKYQVTATVSAEIVEFTK